LPLRVVPTDDGDYEILDGFKRFERWCEAGYRSVPAIIERAGSSIEFKRLLLVANSPPRTSSPLDEARIVESLVKDDQLTLRTAAHLLGHKPPWAAQRLQMATRLSSKAQEKLALGRIGPSLGFALTALPVEDQDRVLDALEKHRIKTADAMRLVETYRVADEVDRRALLKDPLGKLRPAPSPILTPRATELEGRLESFRRVLADLRTFRVPEDLAPSERRRLEALWRSLLQDLAGTAKALGDPPRMAQETKDQEVTHGSEEATGGVQRRSAEDSGQSGRNLRRNPARSITEDSAVEDRGLCGGSERDRSSQEVLRDPEDRGVRGPDPESGSSGPRGGRMSLSGVAVKSRRGLKADTISKSDNRQGLEKTDNISHPP
jgi:hypothetical protein